MSKYVTIEQAKSFVCRNCLASVCFCCTVRDEIESVAKTLEEIEQEEIEAQREYEAAVEYAEYCKQYEPTYNPEDGSM